MSAHMIPRSVSFKNSFANALLGVDLHPRQMFELVGRDKPNGQHHMRYTPEDMRRVWFKKNNVPLPETWPKTKKLKMPSIVVSRMTKGGVGKTSVAVNVAATAAMMGFRVLFIDADPQSTATNLFGVDTSDPQIKLKHAGKFLIRASKEPDADLKEAISPIYEGGFLDLLPSDISLASTDHTLMTTMAYHARADQFLNRNHDFLSRNYDLIVIDTAPGTTATGLAFTYAAKSTGKILVVVEPEGSCIKALEVLQSNLDELQAATEIKPIDMYLVVNKYQTGPKHIKTMMPYLWENYSKNLCESILYSYLGFSRQFDSKGGLMPLVELEPSSTGALGIIDVTKSVIEKFNVTMDRRA